MQINRHLARGLFLAAFALAFGIGSTRYSIGTLNRAGPGLFPLMISGVLLAIAVLMIVRSHFVEKLPMEFDVRNIGMIMLGLAAFALVSKLVNMTLGIVAMVFVVSLAASRRSWKRSVAVSAGLVAVAFAFQKLLGLNLPLF